MGTWIEISILKTNRDSPISRSLQWERGLKWLYPEIRQPFFESRSLQWERGLK